MMMMKMKMMIIYKAIKTLNRKKSLKINIKHKNYKLKVVMGDQKNYPKNGEI